MDRNALVDNGIVFHATLVLAPDFYQNEVLGDHLLGHGQHPVNLSDAEPMKDIGHERLEPHVLDARDILGALEVLARPVLSAFSCVVYEVLGNFTKRTTFFAEVDDDTTATLLGFLDCLFNTKGEVWSACADVGSKDVTAIAFVVDTECEANIGI